MNLYAYAGNNPASYSDPFGLCKRPKGKGVGVCIEAFIASRTALGMPVGDGRGPQSAGGSYKTSHLFSIDPKTGQLSGVSQDLGSTLGVKGEGKLTIGAPTSDGNGGWNIQVTGDAKSVFMPPNFDIDYDFTVHVSESGDVSLAGGSFDGFPSFEVWSYSEAGTPKMVEFYPESNITALGGEKDRQVIPR